MRQSNRYNKTISNFLSVSLDEHLKKTGDGSAEALALFQTMSREVPAYAEFLRENKVDVGGIKNVQGLRELPPINKENYIKKYPLKDLCRDGMLDSCDMVAFSSGSSGEPTLWPRSQIDEIAIARRFEQVFVDSFAADQISTLAVVCFPLGTWIGGMFTAACCRYLSLKGLPIVNVTPGNNKDEILRVIGILSQSFGQTVLLGYPPFLKDVIDTAIARDIDLKRCNLKFVLAGEVFSEDWRALMTERAGLSEDLYSFGSLYGTADAGVLGCETPLTICIRKYCSTNPEMAETLFGERRLPTLVQYDPRSRYFESEEGALLFSGDSGIPLLRYSIGDRGGVYPYEELIQILGNAGFDPRTEVRNSAAFRGREIREMPFVYVFGRSLFTISFFGANIYPENISVGLEQPEINGWTTGKFVMESREDSDRNRRLFIAVELSPGAIAGYEKHGIVASSIQKHLERLNSEFKNYVPAEYRTPLVQFFETGHPDYFPVGTKHRYARK